MQEGQTVTHYWKEPLRSYELKRNFRPSLFSSRLYEPAETEALVPFASYKIIALFCRRVIPNWTLPYKERRR
jgi:hypothetical protein